jgi:hypothetical protein
MFENQRSSNHVLPTQSETADNRQYGTTRNMLIFCFGTKDGAKLHALVAVATLN